MIKAANSKKKAKEMPTVQEETNIAHTEDSSPESQEDVGYRYNHAMLFSFL